jgi:hypothetical protein
MGLFPWTALHSDSEQLNFEFKTGNLFRMQSSLSLLSRGEILNPAFRGNVKLGDSDTVFSSPRFIKQHHMIP